MRSKQASTFLQSVLVGVALAGIAVFVSERDSQRRHEDQQLEIEEIKEFVGYPN